MNPQLKYWLHAPFVIPVYPIMYVQAMRIKKTMPDLPDAPGPTTGDISGRMPPLSVVALGESTIAGVGCEHHGETITGQIAHFLGQKTGRSVHFEAIGKTGIQVEAAIHELVPKLPAEPIDLLFVALGGNQPARWRNSFARLLVAIREKQPHCAIVIANLPTVWQFVAFTPLLQLVMGRLVRLHARAIEDLPKHFPRVWYMNYPIDLRKWERHLPPGKNFTDFFADGVHPSPLTCQFWGEEIAEFVYSNEVLKNSPHEQNKCQTDIK